MPLYPFRCQGCSREEDRTMTVSEYTETHGQLRCSQCEGVMARVFTPIAIKTDTRFFQGLDDGFGNDNRSRRIFRQKCAAAGVPVSGKYFGQLCPDGETLSPFAQASSTGEIKKKLAMLGRGCEGSINMPTPEKPVESKPYRVADDIVNKAVREKVIKEQLRPNKKQLAELRETVRKEITPTV